MSNVSTYGYRRLHWSTYADPELRKGRAGRPYRTWRAHVLRDPVPVCCRCGGAIDKRLPWRHPMSATADHYPIPLSRWVGPLDPSNGAPAHRRCNLSAGNRTTQTLITSPESQSRGVADRRW